MVCLFGLASQNAGEHTSLHAAVWEAAPPPAARRGLTFSSLTLRRLSCVIIWSVAAHFRFGCTAQGSQISSHNALGDLVGTPAQPCRPQSDRSSRKMRVQWSAESKAMGKFEI